MVVARAAAAQHCQWLIDISGLSITGNHCACRVGLFDEVVAVVGVDAGSSRGRFVDAAAERIIFEADRPARAGQSDAREPIFK